MLTMSKVRTQPAGKEMPWMQVRERYPTLKESVYLNYGAAGPLSEDAMAAIFTAYETLQQRGPFSVEANIWAEQELSSTRTLLEKTLDAEAGSIALAESVCAACNIVLWGIDWRPGDHIVVSQSENAGILAGVRSLAKRFALTVTECAVSRASGCEAVADSIEKHLQATTRLVVLSHVLQATGEKMPLQAVQERCRARKVLLLADGAQTAGAMPVSVRDLGLDFYAFPGGKWWCGPSGLAGLYVRPGCTELLHASFAGWRSLRPSNNPGLQRLADARRFESGSMASPLCAGLRTAIELHERVAGQAERLEATLDLAQHVFAGLQELSRHAPLHLIPQERELPESGMIAFVIDGSQPRELVNFLEARRILTREMEAPHCVRACVHYLTTRREADFLLDSIEQFLKKTKTRQPALTGPQPAAAQ